MINIADILASRYSRDARFRSGPSIHLRRSLLSSSIEPFHNFAAFSIPIADKIAKPLKRDEKKKKKNIRAAWRLLSKNSAVIVPETENN